MSSLDWEKLLFDRRRKAVVGGKEESSKTKGSRTEIERDFDRVLFASPTRRLADKTQVFPMDSNDSVRNRLTHSHEVSNLARSVGMALAFNHADEVFGPDHESLNVKRKIPALLAAAGLVHDLGNPPFGHQGEISIQHWFTEKSSENTIPNDFLKFDGNPQTFRLVTRLQVLNDGFGLNLTYATLASMVKYPSTHESQSSNGYSKPGIFQSESDIIEDVWEKTGLRAGIRHPIAHVMEACDDIAYAVIDTEDTVKKGFASFYDLMDHLKSAVSDSPDSRIQAVIDYSTEKNEEFKREKLSSRELNDISMQMFRVQAIYELIEAATNAFVSNIKKIMNCSIPPDFELIEHSDGKRLCTALKEFGKRHGFKNKSVLELELFGNNEIENLMDMLWDSIENKETAFSRYAYSTISENYRRVFEDSKMDGDYKKFQLLSDTISGMTESYLIKHNKHLSKLYKRRIKV